MKTDAAATRVGGDNIGSAVAVRSAVVAAYGLLPSDRRVSGRGETLLSKKPRCVTEVVDDEVAVAIAIQVGRRDSARAGAGRGGRAAVKAAEPLLSKMLAVLVLLQTATSMSLSPSRSAAVTATGRVPTAIGSRWRW